MAGTSDLVYKNRRSSLSRWSSEKSEGIRSDCRVTLRVSCISILMCQFRRTSVRSWKLNFIILCTTTLRATDMTGMVHQTQVHMMAEESPLHRVSPI